MCHVLVPARFVQREKNYTVHEGSNITMECIAEGDRPLSVSWSFNGGSLNFHYNGRYERFAAACLSPGSK